MAFAWPGAGRRVLIIMVLRVCAVVATSKHFQHFIVGWVGSSPSLFWILSDCPIDRNLSHMRTHTVMGSFTIFPREWSPSLSWILIDWVSWTGIYHTPTKEYTQFKTHRLIKNNVPVKLKFSSFIEHQKTLSLTLPRVGVEGVGQLLRFDGGLQSGELRAWRDKQNRKIRL